MRLISLAMHSLSDSCVDIIIIGNKTLCDLCNSKQYRKLRQKKGDHPAEHLAEDGDAHETLEGSCSKPISLAYLSYFLDLVSMEFYLLKL